MELPAGVVARLSCRYPLAFSQMARLAGSDSAFPRPSRALAALKECRAALGRGLLLGPGQKSDGQTKPQVLTEPWFQLHGEERMVISTAQNKGGSAECCWRPGASGLHSLRLLQGDRQVLHQWVQSLSCFLILPQPMDHHSCQRSPPLGHWVCAYSRGAEGGVQREVLPETQPHYT